MSKIASVLSYLDYIRSLSNEMRAANEMLETYRSRMEVGGVSYDHEGSSPSVNPDTLLNMVANFQELSRKWVDTVDRCTRDLDQARSLMMPSKGIERDWAWRHYVERDQWKTIGKAEHMTDSGIRMAVFRSLGDIYDDPDFPDEWR